MKQRERQERSKQGILCAAMQEFGENDYDKVTMESICTKHHISKGMMYHYYSNKDDLFLLCVEETFRALYTCVEQALRDSETQEYVDRIRQFFVIRECFFNQHPWQKRIFENALLHTPEHLEQTIYDLHRPIKKMNQRFIDSIVDHIPLRPGVEKQKATKYLESMEYLLPSVMKSQAYKTQADLHTLLKFAQDMLDMMLFGIVQHTDTV